MSAALRRDSVCTDRLTENKILRILLCSKKDEPEGKIFQNYSDNNASLWNACVWRKKDYNNTLHMSCTLHLGNLKYFSDISTPRRKVLCYSADGWTKVQGHLSPFLLPLDWRRLFHWAVNDALHSKMIKMKEKGGEKERKYILKFQWTIRVVVD